MASEDDMRLQLSKFKSTLSTFASSSSNFRIVTSTGTSPTTSGSQSPSTLYVLDSSFNPPTLAHRHIAASALLQDRNPTPKRLLLLLATQNADKAPKPASFEQRLAMMSIFAQDLSTHLSHSNSNSKFKFEIPIIDIAITKLPYFSDKAASIDDSHEYPTKTTQVHLTGFDTLIRIFNPKYYEDKTLSSLAPFLSKHRLRVTYRPDDSWGGKEEQESYLEALRNGDREGEGGKREWAERIELVEGPGQPVSSTRVREACKKGDKEGLRQLVPQAVAEWVEQEKLYLED